ncbi:hypothetical protein AB4Y32_09805 [Paraburkholderia phymatum]|uniref:Uncharacterized protein n=1 Tax=Paraburkholderia phymatum TaxID=148447 RepID=A0ACC6TXB6_9BURK
MSKITFVSKKPAGALGNFNYEYTCSCVGGSTMPNVTVTAANDNEARVLAQMQCDDSCGEGVKAAIAQFTVTSPESIVRFNPPSAKTVTVTSDRVYESAPDVTRRQFACISFFPADIGYLGIRNNCAECKVAVVSWSDAGVYTYKVSGYDQIVVELVSGTGQLIGEQPC